eukprot:6728030-Prymnesium_polylepis.1
MDHAPRFSDCTNRPGSPDSRGDVEACEVEVDARDDLVAHAVLAVDPVEEAVLLLLVLAVRDVRNCVRLDENMMRMMLGEAGQR